MSSGAWDLDRPSTGGMARGGRSDLADILERVLDKGVVIAGDIAINLLDIELLTVKLRLIVASADTARQMGIDWWTRDPFLTGKKDDDGSDEGKDEERRELEERIARLEATIASLPAAASANGSGTKSAARSAVAAGGSDDDERNT
jgi:hypothetical protein